MNKKSIGALLLSAALLVGATGSTFAYFTGTAKSDQQVITLGNVKVEVTPTTGSQWNVVCRADANATAWQAWCQGDFTTFFQLINNPMGNMDEIDTTNPDEIKYVAPGDVVAKSFTVKNTGKLDAKIKLSLDNLEVKDKDNIPNTSYVWPKSYLFKAYHVNTDGKPGSEVEIDVNAWNQGNFVLDADPGEEIVVYVCVRLDDQMGNALQDGKIKFNLKVDATQWNNPGWNEDGSL